MPLRNKARISSSLLFYEPLEGTKLVQRLRGHSFIYLVLPFQNKKFMEQSNILFSIFLPVLIFFPFMNSSTDKSRLWKRLVWFEAIFL